MPLPRDLGRGDTGDLVVYGCPPLEIMNHGSVECECIQLRRPIIRWTERFRIYQVKIRIPRPKVFEHLWPNVFVNYILSGFRGS